MAEMVHKVTLSTGKEVLLREMKIKHQNLAIKAASKQAGDSNTLLASLMQQEIIKQLIFQIDGKQVSGKEMENLDEVFTYSEFGQIAQVIQKLMGGDSLGEFQTEIVSIGAP